MLKIFVFYFQPGRVVTLIEDEEVSTLPPPTTPFGHVTHSAIHSFSSGFRLFHQVYFFIFQGIVWGQAFQVKEKEAFSYLNNRECELGGYLTTISTFYPRPDAKANKSTKPFPVILYLATSSNRHWLGDSSLPDIANQIVECAGNSGHNVEYLLRLANFVRENIPEAVDEHLFTLERLVRSQIKEKNLCLKTLMGENKSVIDDSRAEGGQEQEPEGGEAGRSGSRSALHFTSRVSPKKLRCVNIC